MQKKHFNTVRLFCGAALFFLVTGCGPGSNNAETKAPEQPQSSLLNNDHPAQNFVLDAYSYNLMLLHYGQLAGQKVERPSLLSFVELSLPMHQNQNKELEAYANQQQWSLPRTVGSDVKAYAQQLSELPAPEFEAAYLKLVSDIQRKSVPTYEQATQLADTTLAAWANRALPKLEAHAETVDELLAEGNK